MNDDTLATTRAVLRLAGREQRRETDQVTVEEPLEIRLGPSPLAVTMRTPGHDRELAAGFCLTEGVIVDPDDLDRVEPCREADSGNVVVVTLAEQAAAHAGERAEAARRDLFVSSSCGLCGKQSIDRIEQRIPPLGGGFTVPRELIIDLPRRMQEAQDSFRRTGGLHAAAIFDVDGGLRILREDVGRHNAVDKVIGNQLLLGRLPADPAILLVSGRTSFEITQKAAMAGLTVICSISAASSLAIDFAERVGQTLVGFVREDRMNVYAHPERLELA